MILFSIHGNCQKFTISGYVKDASSGEILIGATLSEARSAVGTISNTHGFYSLTLNSDTVTLIYSYVGFNQKYIQIYLDRDTLINVNLESAVLDELIVQASKTDDIYESTMMSGATIPISQIKSMPALFGETDILKVLQLMPGVQSGNEGSTGLYVRGGGPDQNLLLLDGVPIYNSTHLFGFFSIFNADAINHVDLIKGGFPARYGGRLSSVIDISMKEGNQKKLAGEGSIGLLSAKATIEGPIIKNKSSFLISARRTYIDAIAQPIIRKQTLGSKSGYYFYDLNAKLNYNFNANNHVFLSAYLGKDKAYSESKSSYYDTDFQTDIFTKDDFKLTWGNLITALRWTHIFTPRLFCNISTTYSRYQFNVNQSYEETQSSLGLPVEDIYYRNKYSSSIRDWASSVNFEYLPNPHHAIRFGINNIWHEFMPGVFSYRSSTEKDTIAGANQVGAYEFASYFEDDWRLSRKLKANIGVHVSGFNVEDKLYHSIQPRLSLRYLLQDQLALKFSYSKMTQYIHLLTNAGIGLPTDLWVSSTRRIPPQQSSQMAVGIAKTFKSQFEFTLEGYLKNMNNLIEYKDGASYVIIDSDWQDNVAIGGVGKSYGVEMLLQKKIGVISGWAGYTLSKTTRQFENLNYGKQFPYKYDRRHDISLAVAYIWDKKPDRKREVSLIWVYGSGNAITLPKATYESSSNSLDSRYYNYSNVIYYGERNSFRMRSYHRLDLSFSWIKEKKWGQRKWTIAIYNVYNRLNPYFIDLGRDNLGNNKFVEYSLFPTLPSISYSIKF